MYMGADFNKAITQLFKVELWAVEWPENCAPTIYRGKMIKVVSLNDGAIRVTLLATKKDGLQTEKTFDSCHVATDAYEANQILMQIKEERSASIADAYRLGKDMIEGLKTIPAETQRCTRCAGTGSPIKDGICGSCADDIRGEKAADEMDSNNQELPL